MLTPNNIVIRLTVIFALLVGFGTRSPNNFGNRMADGARNHAWINLPLDTAVMEAGGTQLARGSKVPSMRNPVGI